MSCERTEELIHAYVDGELDMVNSLDIERHLNECQICSKSYAALLALRSAVGSVYHAPPAQLHQRVASVVNRNLKPRSRSRTISWQWVAFACSFVLLNFLSWGVFHLLSRPSADDVLAHELVASHVRSLMADHLADVPSSDQHTVKPWFNGKLDFSPPVIDLDDQGFTLVGGRLDYVNDRPVAALVYQRRKHFVNLFIWPETNDSDHSGTTTTVQGYDVVYWRQSDMNCWAVSDLNMEELKEFTQLLKSRSSH